MLSVHEQGGIVQEDQRMSSCWISQLRIAAEDSTSSCAWIDQADVVLSADLAYRCIRQITSNYDSKLGEGGLMLSAPALKNVK